MNNLSFSDVYGVEVDLEQLRVFEAGLDPMAPEQNEIPCRVLGYGEVSTVFEIHTAAFQNLALKRISIFIELAELQRYLVAYRRYLQLLTDDIGIQLPADSYAAFLNDNGKPILYSIQEKLSVPALGHKALHWLTEQDALILYERVLHELRRVWDFNELQTTVQLGIDGQISNWAIGGDFLDDLQVDYDTPLKYIDTSTPLLRIDGIEQLEPEMFLRSAPSFLAWILRRFFLDDVINRYYDPHKIIVDLIANIFKEQKPELIPPMIELGNERLAQMDLKPVTMAEVQAYYREDKFIWQFYSRARRLDRWLHKVRKRPYPYILPGNVKR